MVQQMKAVDVCTEWEKLTRILPYNTSKIHYVGQDVLRGAPYPSVTVAVNGYVITLTARDYSGGLKATTVSSCYAGTNAFGFSVRSGEWFNKLDNVLRSICGYVHIDNEFDDLAWVQSSNPDRVREMLNNGWLKEQMKELGSCLLAMVVGADGYTLTFADIGTDVTVDSARLVKVFDLVRKVMNWLDMEASGSV